MKLRFNKNIMCLSLLISFCFVRAIPVAPIVDGEGIWAVVSRIGECVDSLANGCEASITQADIGAGGVFTLSGVSNTTYCLAEDISFSTGAAITIDGVSNVTIDLNGHSIDGTNSGDNAIVFSGADSSNVTIQNGTIFRCAGDAILHEGYYFPLELVNLHIRNISFFDSPSDRSINLGTNSPPSIVQDIMIENCLFHNTEGVDVDSCDGIVMRNCGFNVNSSSIFQECSLSGSYFLGRYMCIEDCLLTGTFGARGAGVSAFSFDNVVCRNNKIIGPQNSGFDFNLVNSLYMENCIVQNAGTSAYIMGNGAAEIIGSGCLNNCHAIRAGQRGFVEFGSSNIKFFNCSAIECGLDGFLCSPGASGSRNIVFDSCAAINNGADGFDLDATSSLCKVINCCSEGNASFGYRNDAPLGANIFLGNSSFGDGSGGFGGTGGVDPGLVLTGAAEVAGANKWTNVTFP